MAGPETEVTTIPQIRRVFRMAKAELDALAGLRDGALGYATDDTILYRQNGDGAANWEAITSLGREVADGNYAGNMGDDRQITTGFICSCVIIHSTNTVNAMMIPNRAWSMEDCAIKAGGSELHATDGFTVYQTGDSLNETGFTYYYWAIGD